MLVVWKSLNVWLRYCNTVLFLGGCKVKCRNHRNRPPLRLRSSAAQPIIRRLQHRNRRSQPSRLGCEAQHCNRRSRRNRSCRGCEAEHRNQPSRLGCDAPLATVATIAAGQLLERWFILIYLKGRRCSAKGKKSWHAIQTVPVACCTV
jgi:hypothetical protein